MTRLLQKVLKRMISRQWKPSLRYTGFFEPPHGHIMQVKSATGAINRLGSASLWLCSCVVHFMLLMNNTAFATSQDSEVTAQQAAICERDCDGGVTIEVTTKQDIIYGQPPIPRARLPRGNYLLNLQANGTFVSCGVNINFDEFRSICRGLPATDEMEVTLDVRIDAEYSDLEVSIEGAQPKTIDLEILYENSHWLDLQNYELDYNFPQYMQHCPDSCKEAEVWIEVRSK